MSLLTEQEITEIAREAVRGSATRRDGSTSQRIARAIESAVIEKIKAQGLLRPKMYWEDAECGYESYQDIEALLDAFGDYDNIKVGATYSLNEAYYFDAEFEVTKIPDDTSDDYEVKRISGTKVYKLPEGD